MSAVERWQIAGHDQIVVGLDNALQRGQTVHAYLLTGPVGVGRTALALAFARALNCEASPGERPCNVCDNCVRIARGVHPDVVLADMAWQENIVGRSRGDQSRARQRFSIDAIKWLRNDIVTRPMLGRWKVQIIDDAGRFSADAPEAFLKTLEEPPPYAVIILIAESPDQVPETIRSRCRQITLGAVSRATIEATLRSRGTDENTAVRLARSAMGRIAWALQSAANPKLQMQRQELVETAFEHLTTPLGRLSLTGVVARDHTRKRDQTFALLDTLTGLWRDALLAQVGLVDSVAFPEVTDRLVAFTASYTTRDLYRALWATQRAAVDLEANVQARIALHAMVMQWPQ